MKRNLLFWGVTLLCFVSCKSEQQKALEVVIAANDLSALRGFATANPEMSEKVRQSYTVALEQLIADSTLFAGVINAGSIIEKYDAEVNYLTSFPQGSHAEEINAVLPEHKESAEKIKNRLDDMRKAFNKYTFRPENSIDGGMLTELGDDVYEFLGPDESGKGEIKIKAKPILVKVNYWSGYRLGRVNRFCEGTYYVNDELQIVATITEKRSYKSDGSYGDEKTKELISDMKKEWPAPKASKIILNYSSMEGVPSLSGRDQKGAIYLFSPQVR